MPTATTYFAGNPPRGRFRANCSSTRSTHARARRVGLKLVGLAVATALVLGAIFIVARWSPEWFSARIVGWLLYISPLFRVGEFLLGVALAAALKRGFRVPIGVIPGVLLVALWFHTEYRLSPQYFGLELRVLTANLSYVVLPLLFASVIASVAQLDCDGARSVLRTKPMVLLGQWSYALYLVHATIIYFLLASTATRPTAS